MTIINHMNLHGRRRQKLLVNYLDHDEKTGSLWDRAYACAAYLELVMSCLQMGWRVQQKKRHQNECRCSVCITRCVFVPCLLCLFYLLFCKAQSSLVRFFACSITCFLMQLNNNHKEVKVKKQSNPRIRCISNVSLRVDASIFSSTHRLRFRIESCSRIVFHLCQKIKIGSDFTILLKIL